MSGAEVILWTRLRGRGGERPTFRRQHPIGSIIIDFYCPSVRLAVEVDGATHWDDEAQWRDEKRDHWLRSQGVTVLRIPASRVYNDLNSVVDGILLQVGMLSAAAKPQQIPSMGLAPSTTRSTAGGPPPAASRGR